MYEFSVPHIPGHRRCDSLTPVKVSSTRTNLICTDCKKIVGCWDDLEVKKIYPDNASYFSESTLDNMK